MSTHKIPFAIYKMKIALNDQNPQLSNVSQLKNEFETAMVNEPSVFEPLKVSCMYGLVP